MVERAPMELCPISDPNLLEDVYRLRAAVWQALAPDAFATDRWADDHDLHASHWALLVDGAAVAAARFCAHDNAEDLPDERFYRSIAAELVAPIGSLNRLVVAEPFRRAGLATRLDHVRLESAAAAKCRTIVCCTENEHRVRALVRRGFEVIGPAANVDPRAVAQGRHPVVLVLRRNG